MSLPTELRSRFFRAYKESIKAMNFTFSNDLQSLYKSKMLLKQTVLNPMEMKEKMFKDLSESKEDLIKHLEDMNKILIQNVAQAKQLSKHKYELKMHDKIELGDNESIKDNKGSQYKNKPFKRCCD